MIINFRPTEEDVIRCGWTFPTYVGNAVTRNRLKRWGREEFAKWAAGQSKGKDINVVLRRRDKEFYKELSREEFNRAVSRIFRAFEKIDR